MFFKNLHLFMFLLLHKQILNELKERSVIGSFKKLARTRRLRCLGTYLVETKLSWKSVQTMTKKSSKFMKKITHVDDMMIHNLVKYLVQSRLSFVRYKNNKFHKRSLVWTGYFTRLCIIVSSTFVIFFMNLDDFFVVVCTDFHKCLVSTRYVPHVKCL